MNSTDRLIFWLSCTMLTFCLAIPVTIDYGDSLVIKQKSLASIEMQKLKVRLVEAKAKQAEYRAMELGILCEMVTKTGQVYLSKEC